MHFILKILFIVTLIPLKVSAQSLIDDLSAPVSISSQSGQFDLFTEYIKIIGGSRRIFIITNENNRLMKGDFFSIVIEGKLTARALVASNRENLVGIKILRIDSLANWARIRKGLAVEILKGDDSYYRSFQDNKDKPKTEQIAEQSRIQSSEDLFSSNVLQEDFDLDDKKNRNITSDNIIGIGYGLFAAQSAEAGGNEQFPMFNAQWAHQIADNIWIEGSYGQSLLNEYPGPLLDTLVSNFTVRFKYNFKGPWYTFFKPYIGFQMINVSSPEAGQDIPGKPLTPEQRQREIELVNALRRNQMVIGVTVLRRLVPGWFARADLGTDIISGGVSIEF
jgi:hypothetical protein